MPLATTGLPGSGILPSVSAEAAFPIRPKAPDVVFKLVLSRPFGDPLNAGRFHCPAPAAARGLNCRVASCSLRSQLKLLAMAICGILTACCIARAGYRERHGASDLAHSPSLAPLQRDWNRHRKCIPPTSMSAYFQQNVKLSDVEYFCRRRIQSPTFSVCNAGRLFLRCRKNFAAHCHSTNSHHAVPWPLSFTAACAAASRATGTRNGEQDT